MKSRIEAGLVTVNTSDLSQDAIEQEIEKLHKLNEAQKFANEIKDYHLS